MSACSEEIRVMEFLSGEAAAGDKAEIERHILECTRCAETALLWSAFREKLARESGEAHSEAFVRDVMKRVRAPERIPAWANLMDLCLQWRPQLVALLFALALIVMQGGANSGWVPNSDSGGASSSAKSCELLSNQECSLEVFLGISGEVQ